MALIAGENRGLFGVRQRSELDLEGWHRTLVQLENFEKADLPNAEWVTHADRLAWNFRRFRSEFDAHVHRLNPETPEELVRHNLEKLKNLSAVMDEDIEGLKVMAETSGN